MNLDFTRHRWSERRSVGGTLGCGYGARSAPVERRGWLAPRAGGHQLLRESHGRLLSDAVDAATATGRMPLRLVATHSLRDSSSSLCRAAGLRAHFGAALSSRAHSNVAQHVRQDLPERYPTHRRLSAAAVYDQQHAAKGFVIVQNLVGEVRDV
jgi:hypothetical protein